MMKRQALFFLILLLVAWTGCAKQPSVKAPVRKPQINGEIGEVSLYTSGIVSRTAKRIEARYSEEKTPVYKTVKSFYQSAYMTPGSINEDTLADLFTSSAGKRVLSRLPQFSLDKVVEELKSVDDGTLTVGPIVFYRTDRSFFAVTEARFMVTGELKGGSHVLIESEGTFYLLKRKEGWLIFDCDLEQSADTEEKDKEKGEST